MNRIKEIRMKKGISQSDLAKKLGTTQQALSLYERGKREPKLKTWQKLANFFNVPVTYLQGLSDVSDPNVFKNPREFFPKVDYSQDHNWVKISLNEAKAMAREDTLTRFNNIYEAIENYGDIYDTESLQNDVKKIEKFSQMDDIIFSTDELFRISVKANIGDKKAIEIYKEIQKMMNNYFGYDDEY